MPDDGAAAEPVEAHRRLMASALEQDAAGQRALLDGEPEAASRAFAQAAELYGRSWQEASPTSYGRLVGLIKAAILAGDATEQAGYVRAQLGGADRSSATAAYAAGLAALQLGDDETATRCAAVMGNAPSDAFGRAAAAIRAIAVQDAEGYGQAIVAIVGDFEGRSEHLTGVPIADTAVVLERLAARRGLAARVSSALLPATGD